MALDPNDSAGDARDSQRPRTIAGIAAALVIAACALIVWMLNGPRPATGGMTIIVKTTVPPETPPINPPAKKEQDAKGR